MKRRIVLFCILFMGMKLFAEPIVNFFTADVPDISILSNLQITLKPDEKNQSPAYSSVISVDMGELCTDAGFKVSAGKMDAVAKIIYWPTFWGHLNVGPGITYHFYDYKDVFTEHDLIASLCLLWTKGPVFDMFTRFGYIGKFSVIPAVYSAKPVVESHSLNFEFVVRWHIYDKVTVYSSFNSDSMFDYPLFCTPVFSTGFEMQLAEHINAGLDLSSTWVDMFTVPSNLTELDINLFCRMYL